jgi:hypothetical protein
MAHDVELSTVGYCRYEVQVDDKDDGGAVPPRKKKGSGTESLGFEDVLWKAADKLRGSMDASEYKHVVLCRWLLAGQVSLSAGTLRAACGPLARRERVRRRRLCVRSAPPMAEHVQLQLGEEWPSPAVAESPCSCSFARNGRRLPLRIP